MLLHNQVRCCCGPVIRNRLIILISFTAIHHTYKILICLKHCVLPPTKKKPLLFYKA